MTSYKRPVTDRQQSDIIALNSKAYINATDWRRIYLNAKSANGLVEAIKGITIVFNEITEPITINTIPTVAELNIVLANINRTRTAANLPPVLGLDELPANWQTGTGDSPAFADANAWEQVVALIEAGIKQLGDDESYPWVTNAVTPTRRARCGVARCGAGLTFNNGFRKYT